MYFPRMREGGYPLDSGNPNRLWLGLAPIWVDDLVVRDGIDRHGLLGETEEELAATFGSPPVEAKSELIEVVVEVLLTDGALVGAQ